MTNPFIDDDVETQAAAYISDEEAEAVVRWLETDEAREVLRRAVTEANRAIDRLDEVRSVTRRDLNRQISMRGIGYT